MKKTKLLLAILAVLIFAFFAMGSGDSTEVDQGSGETKKNTEQNIGDYTVVIDSCRLAQDYAGKDVVIVKYIFTNVASDEETAFWTAFDDNVYQGGIGLNSAYVLKDSANYSSDNQMKEIKKGATIEVEVAYELNDTTTDIEVEVEELFSFNDTKIKKTFSIVQ